MIVILIAQALVTVVYSNSNTDRLVSVIVVGILTDGTSSSNSLEKARRATPQALSRIVRDFERPPDIPSNVLFLASPKPPRWS